MYSILNNYHKAIRDYKKAIALKSDYDDAYCNLGNIYHDMRCFDKAIWAYKKAIEISPNSSDIYENLGFVYFDLEKYNNAVKAFKKLFEINSDSSNSDTHYCYALSCAHVGDKESTLKHYSILKSLDVKLSDKLNSELGLLKK